MRRESETMPVILLVDDEETLLKSLVETFRGQQQLQGCEYLTANNGDEALTVLKSRPVDLVVTDVKMPGKDGFELLSLMGRAYPEMPVIVMTAFGTEAIRSEVLEAGAVSFVDKPIDVPDLIEKIRQGLSASAKGEIRGIGIIDLLQIVNMERKTCTMAVEAPGRQGTLFVADGEVVDAEVPGCCQGLDAALEIVTWQDTAIGISGNFRRTKRRVEMSVSNLIMEAMYRKDEQARVNNKTSPEPTPEPERQRDKTRPQTGREHTKKEVGTMANQAQIDAILSTLDGIDGAHGATLVSKDGMVIASRLDKRYADDKIAALVTASIATANKVVTEAGFGKMETMLIEGTDGKLALIYSSRGGFFISLVGTKDLNLGMARMALQEALDSFHEI